MKPLSKQQLEVICAVAKSAARTSWLTSRSMPDILRLSSHGIFNQPLFNDAPRSELERVFLEAYVKEKEIWNNEVRRYTPPTPKPPPENIGADLQLGDRYGFTDGYPGEFIVTAESGKSTAGQDVCVVEGYETRCDKTTRYRVGEPGVFTYGTEVRIIERASDALKEER